MRTFVLVSCCAEKLAHAAPARELYRSALFRLARAYVERERLPWVILSALHGVVQPDAVLEPYDCRMPTRQADAIAWAAGAAQQLLQLAGPAPTRFLSLCGERYTQHLGDVEGAMRGGAWCATGHVLEFPLAGLFVGRRLQWLSQRAGTALLRPSLSSSSLEIHP